METSDSEYFESADEDFESDYEDHTLRHKSVPQTVSHSHKINEPELCKLKITESQETTCDPKPEIQDIKVPTVGSLIGNSEPLHVKDNIVGEDTNKQHKPEEKITSHTHQTSHLEIKTTEVNQKETEKTEENLWDDDEIDWGSEAAKEESQITELTPSSKNEDSGWDDFDVEWDATSNGKSDDVNKSKPKSESAKEISNSPSTTQPEKRNLWEDDDGWEPLEKPEEKPKEVESTWGNWGTWGVSSLLNTATQSVSSITSHVSQGFSTVLESSIGIPEPEEMVRINKALREKEITSDKEETGRELQQASDNSPTTSVGFGLGNLVSGVSHLTKFVESTGTKVITGGLDTLEAIGKKTVEVLQEGDPGLKKKRALLKLDTGKPNLSQILREAKERAEEENKELAQKHIEKKRVKNYEALFDDHQGLVHLEALEMLSKLCNIKLQNLNNSLTGVALKDMQETLDQVKELCELPEDEEDDKVSADEARETITNAINEINIPIRYDKVYAICNETDTWLKNINTNFIDDGELHQQAIDMLAQLTACAVEQFHKAGELLLVKEHRSTADEADSLVQITATVKSLILNEAGKFTDKLSTIDNSDKDKINEHITNIFYEAANSGRYIQDAFQLLIPVLQAGAV